MPDGITVSNSSCLIGLGAVSRLELLHQLYGTIVIPEAVAHEFGISMPGWVDVRAVQDRAAVRALSIDLGGGEAEAIALAIETSPARIILDDKKARRIATQLQLPVTGTLALLLSAKRHGLIASVREV